MSQLLIGGGEDETIEPSVHFSSESMTWETPQEVFDALNKEFCFTVDVCAVPATAKCNRFYTPAENGLPQRWAGSCWMNPPYGREIGRWMRKAYEASKEGATGRLSRTIPYRYRMVARVRHARRYTSNQRAAQVRWGKTQCPIPIGHCNLSAPNPNRGE